MNKNRETFINFVEMGERFINFAEIGGKIYKCFENLKENMQYASSIISLGEWTPLYEDILWYS